MATKRKYKSDAFEAIYSAAEALHKVGAISKSTMRDFDASCLSVPEPPRAEADQEAPGTSSRESACIRALPEHQREHCGEVGDRSQASQRSGAEVAGRGTEART